MNRYPLWKYLVIAVALIVGALYTLPNFFPEAPAVQVSSSKATIKELIDDLGEAADAGMLDDPQMSAERTPLELDERGLRRLTRLLARTHEQALAIASESSARASDGSAIAFPTALAILHFKRADTSS